MLDFNGIFGAVVPMYLVIGLAYASVRWFKIFSPEQCFGINRFLVKFAVPFLVVDLMANNNPYTMNFSVVAADIISKLTILAALVIWKCLSKNGSIEWVITLFSLVIFPNTILIGFPVLQSMYGANAGGLLVQVVVVQVGLWFNVLMAMYEYRASKLLIAQQFPETSGSIAFVKLSPDVRSLSGRDEIEVNGEVAGNGKLHFMLRSSSVPSMASLHSLESVESNTHNEPYRSSHNSIRVADASHDFEIMVEPPESSSQQETTSKSPAKEAEEGKKENPPANFVTKLILIAVWRKVIRNPNTYATIVGIAWSLIAYRFNIKMPLILKGTISMLSKTVLGISMFSLGLFTGLQPKIWACSKSMLVISTAFRYLVSPVVMAAASVAVGLRGVVFEASTLQAALPTAVTSFAFARQYNVHTEILSTSIIFTTAIVLPVVIVYNILLRLVQY